ncbi:MAG: hypothetical protein ABS85_10665 [Sphingobacteriales bacterium SCN 48-20]|uniref:hypothetical protein n=1 Tax=Terrimonas ferruginea TaxID=249 RepID=UPI000869850A|nr:hypothetical protein [Terrimonas ferruginea]MBN8782435.1 hypothetical protein [Terrimonas ferruginea]ODT92115.1 MAG: hypothetical protein ABS85_10665 [Sphingobacteriales bacterium SCN 48-20]OJW42947.1 MAG: hypothetical protein BGO56_13025 [Sphingobacteriales bacterium 48-107]
MNSAFSPDKEGDQFISPGGRQWQQAGNARSLLRYNKNQVQIHIAEFERQFHLKKTIRIYERLGKPDYFQPVASLREKEVAEAWSLLSELLLVNGIMLGVCNQAITTRELYRFATEELFGMEIQDIDSEGIIHYFVYDDFHPDHAQNNVTLVLNHCLYQIFRKDPMEWVNSFRKQKLYLNGYEDLNIEEMVILINGFKERVSRFEMVEFTDISSNTDGRTGTVKGMFRLKLRMDHAAYCLGGKWTIQLERNLNNKWKIHAVEIPGIDF